MKKRPKTGIGPYLFAVVHVLLFLSCRGSYTWNADVKTFVDDGLSILDLEGFTAETGGSARSIIPSGGSTTLVLDIQNPRSLTISSSVSWDADAFFDSKPAISVLSPTRLNLAFTPSLQAEHRDLAFAVGLSAPALNRAYPPILVTIRCNTPPGSIGTGIDAALDSSGCAFIAFRLPSAPTDDDLARADISWARADGTAGDGSISLPLDQASLCADILTCEGRDLLGPHAALDRYYRPASLSTGDDYLFTVVLIDTEGLRSEAARTTSSASTYSLTYLGNGHSAGSPPADSAAYRHTKSVTVLGPGGMLRTGHSFARWDTAADGRGSAYAPGAVFAMGSANLGLYAIWSVNDYRISFDSQGGSPVSALVAPYASSASLPAAPLRAGHSFAGWNSAAAGTGTNYAAGGSLVLPANDLSLYAIWTINSYALSFDSQGGSQVAAQSIFYQGLAAAPAASVKAGHTFLGWYKEPACLAPWSFTVDRIQGDTSLYARWVPNDSIIVGFVLNPSYGSIDFSSASATLVRGATLVLSPSRADATSWRWYVDGVLEPSQSGAVFRWDSTGKQPGQYLIGAEARYGGYPCTGSIRVTVTY